MTEKNINQVPPPFLISYSITTKCNLKCKHCYSDSSPEAGSDDLQEVVLLYDILHYYYFPQKRDRQQLLCEMYRILKPNAILSLYPTHLRSRMEPKLGEVKREIEKAKFREEGEYPGVTMVHNDKIEEGLIINFRKEEAVG